MTKKTGKGIYTYSSKPGNPTGDIYDGEWLNDKKKGFGTYTYVDGDKYEGSWDNDKKNGQGVFTFANGQIYHNGLWVDDAAQLSETEQVNA